MNDPGCMDSGINFVVSIRDPSSLHLGTDSGHIKGSGGKKLKVKLEIIGDENSDQLKENRAEKNTSRSSDYSIMRPEKRDKSDDKREATEGFPLSTTKKLESQLPSSNSSKTSDLFQVDSKKANQSETRTVCLANPLHVINIEIKDYDSAGSSNGSAKSEKSNGSRGPTSASQVSDATRESVITYQSPTQSPPIQKMDRLEGYDPFRIPSSVFQRSKSTTPLEWSVASNESLFSIHVGNNSFSRDHVFLGDLGKSGDCTKSDELNVPSPPTTIPPIENESNGMELKEEPKTEDVAESTIRDAEGVSEDLSERKVPLPAILWDSSHITHLSEGSESSTNSFAFPIRKKSACPSCYCSNCSWAFCYYLWPRFYFRWPCCYRWNCSRASCYCWNCSRKRLCCHSSNILADGVQGEALSADAKKKHMDTVGATASSKSSAKSWFICCSCCTSRSSCSSCKWDSCCSSCRWSSCCSSCKWSSCCSSCKWDSCCKWSSCGSCPKWGSCGSCPKWDSCGSCSKWELCGSCCEWGSCCSCCTSISFRCCNFRYCTCNFSRCCRLPDCCHC